MFKRKQAQEDQNKDKRQKLTSSGNVEPWRHVFNDASIAFKENKFENAIALFTRALSMNPNHTTILDCRAASYEKIHNLNLALRDAASIVKIAPTESRGYLRVGKILTLQNKHKKAISIYARGLEKVNPQDKRYSIMLDLKKAAEKKSDTSSTCDFMRVLPYDVISTIFSHLSFDRRIQCTAVSHTWRNFALNWSGMWRDLDFGNRKITHTLVKRYMGYAQGRHVRRFSIIDADKTLMGKIFQLFIDENCQYIETLDLIRCDIPITIFLRMLRLSGKHIKSIRLDEADLDLATLLSEIVPNCPKLTHLSAIQLEMGSMSEVIQSSSGDISQPLSNLTHLRLSIEGRDNSNWILRQCKSLSFLDIYSVDLLMTDIAEYILNESLSNLDEFYFSHGTNYNRSTQWPLPSNGLRNISPVMSQSKMNTFGIYGDPSFTGEYLHFIISRYHSTLKHLIIRDCRSLDSTLARLAVSPGLPSIEVLDLPGCIELQEPDLLSIISSCPTLQELDLSFISGVTDGVMINMGTTLKKLRRLNISCCNSVTGVGLHKVVDLHRQSLEKVVLNNCTRIGPDAVHWSRGVLGKGIIECKYK